MKHRILLATTVLVAGVGSAFAADEVFQPVAYDWSGFYAGVAVGYGTGSTSWTTVGAPALTGPAFDLSVALFDQTPDGILGGVFAGYNAAMGGLVVGVEASIDYADINSSSSIAIADFVSVLSGPDSTYQYELDWLGVVRARVGVPVDQYMPYLAGGISFAGMSASGLVDGITDGAYNPTPQSSSTTAVGFNVGAGIDFQVGGDWIVGADYQYHYFDQGFSIPGSTGYETSFDDLHTAKLRISRKF